MVQLREGFARLSPLGLSFEAWQYHPQLPDVTDLARAKVNLCLGTDSLASMDKKNRQTIELNMFTEMQTLAAARPSLAPKNILHLEREGVRHG